MTTTMSTLQRTIAIISVMFVLSAIVLTFFIPFQTIAATLNQTLDFGDSNSDVTSLQTYLSTDANIYPSKLVTGYFGQLTKAGVERFQTTNGIVSNGTPATTGYGRVGPITRAAINVKIAGGGTPTGDVNAPIFRSVGVTTGNSNASVSWTASESSHGKVYYDTNPIRMSNVFEQTGVFSGEPNVSGTLAQYDNAARASHTVNINNLASNTTYYYVVVIFDSTKNVSITGPASFRTTQ